MNGGGKHEESPKSAKKDLKEKEAKAAESETSKDEEKETAEPDTSKDQENDRNSIIEEEVQEEPYYKPKDLPHLINQKSTEKTP